MTEDEYTDAMKARPLVRYVVLWPNNGVIVQTFVDPDRARYLAACDPDGEAQVVKMVEVTE